MTSGPLPWTNAAAAPRLWIRGSAIRSWLLFASLAANVFLLAHAAVPMLRPRHQPGFAGMTDHFARHLAPDDARRFRAVLDAQRPAFESTRRDMDQSRALLSRAIAQTPYDEGLVRARMSDWQGRLQAMSNRFGDTLLQALPVLSADGRARLADAADHAPPPPPPERPRDP